ncbi:MAG: ribonuclease E/G, partial [Hyphomicrobiales bacterium]|nr:ribonuclease E/G [Hyphomicrobiales bacterium]
MANKMLIDATHPEETRVVVVRGNKVEEFDFESAARKQLRGNIYLAKVTRVEPSLQAAFVDYGGNRHGFLAFTEIHPDYYQIPVADRQALLAAEEAEDARADKAAAASRRERARAADEAESEPQAAAKQGNSGKNGNGSGIEPENDNNVPHGKGLVAETGGGIEEFAEDDETVESVGAEDALEELPVRGEKRFPRTYKIQEVIKRRQILLVQVVKEERGTKGAALTTYLSLAGRYCVLMPNSARGGGISRKITSIADRRRLRKVAEDLQLPKGMGVILRTAGASRTKAEVKRDFEFLIRQWESVRELTLKSTAPALVYEEGSLVRRSIRDHYSKEIDEVLVAGDEAYKDAKSFMRMLMPSHAKNVQPYKDSAPIFTKSGIESQLDAMFSPQVTLKSGGYIVLNQTEALVSIDVNSGRSTREHNIEDTALSTNLEAAAEVARQLRLRDLAGLIVIDFIDMEEKRNKRAVERKLKECLRLDRARIQVGHISHFGLLEMSRQRLRAGVVEGSTQTCPHCLGTGVIRSTESVALYVLRAVEDALMKGHPTNLAVHTNVDAALYILNQKRGHLRAIEKQFGVSILIEADEKLVGTQYEIERGEPAAWPAGAPEAVTAMAEVEEEGEEAIEAERAVDEEDEGEARRGRRRRRRRGRGRGREIEEAATEGEVRQGDGGEEAEQAPAARSAEGPDGGEREGRRPRRRG